MARPILTQLPAAQRQDLANRILAYLNDAVIAAHLGIDHSGAHLLEGHREYIRELENFLQANGGGAFVPLPKWDPATPIPAEFNVVKPQDDSTARPALVNLNPNRPLPAAFQRPALCSIRNADALGNALDGWHASVHIRVGGTMRDATISPAAPIFWCWHAFIDDVYSAWLTCPSVAPPLLPLFNAIALEGNLPSGKVTPQLFEEWAAWGEKLNLQGAAIQPASQGFAAFVDASGVQASGKVGGEDASLIGAIRDLTEAVKNLAVASTRGVRPGGEDKLQPAREFALGGALGAMPMMAQLAMPEMAAPGRTDNRAPFRRLSQEEVWYPLVTMINRGKTSAVPVEGMTPLQAYRLSFGTLRNEVKLYFFPEPLQPMPAAYFAPDQLTGALSYAIHEFHNQQFPA